jgi:hypothetical protein
MNALGNATLLAAAEGNSVKAARILDVQEAAYEEMGRSLPAHARRIIERYVAVARTQLGDAAWEAAWKRRWRTP